MFVKLACKTCGARYDIPDGRLSAAGDAGLRVRCSKCRAIMVVSHRDHNTTPTSTPPVDAAFDDVPSLDLSHVALSDDSLEHLALDGGPQFTSSGFRRAGGDDAPATMSASGVYRPAQGVKREITGLFFPEFEELRREQETRSVLTRVWYAAVDGKSRGPFTASEMITLAEKGKVRDSSLVWRPGLDVWLRVRDGTGDGPTDLSWLRDVVVERKRREQEAQRLAVQRHGIQPLLLDKPVRKSTGRVTTPRLEPKRPPALPRDALLDAALDAELEDASPVRLEVALQPTPTPTRTPGIALWAMAGMLVAVVVVGALLVAPGIGLLHR